MKKGTFIMAVAVAAGLASCTAQSPKANLKTDVDSLSYAAGIEYTSGLDQYLFGQVGLDSADLKTFVDGFIEGINKTSNKDIAYMTGQAIGQQTVLNNLTHLNQRYFGNDSTIQLDKDNFLAGFIDAVNKKAKMSEIEAKAYLNAELEAIKTRAMEATHGAYKTENEQFLEENKNKEGILTTESGLQYKILKEGTGEVPEASSRVKVNYRGTLIDGTEFDANDGMTFRANQVIPGWTEALTMMPVGSKWELYIPQNLAYGSRAQGKIPPFSTLIFEVELLEIEK